MNSTLKRKSQLARMMHQFLLDEHFRLCNHCCSIDSSSVWSRDKLSCFKKIAARSQAILFAQAVLDSNAFAIAFQHEIFSAR
jgi:hypothetical protein